MATVKHKALTLDDTIWTVLDVLEERTEIPLETLKELSRRVSGMDDREAKRARILELADELHGNAENGPGVG